VFPLPGYEQQRLALPPVLDVVERIERERYSELVRSTPGPVGSSVSGPRTCSG